MYLLKIVYLSNQSFIRSYMKEEKKLINKAKRQAIIEKSRVITRNVAAPNGAVMATVSAEALAVIGKPNGRGMVLGAREEQISISIVLEKS